LIVYIY